MIFKHVDTFAIVKETVLLRDTGKNCLRFKTECGLTFLEAWILYSNAQFLANCTETPEGVLRGCSKFCHFKCKRFQLYIKQQKTSKADVLINFRQNCSNDLECISSYASESSFVNEEMLIFYIYLKSNSEIEELKEYNS